MRKLSPLAGKPIDNKMLVDIPKLISAFFTETPDVSNPEERVSFGTSGHRGSSFERSFNEWHILAITQAICEYRKQQNIDGPLFIGMDTHALSQPAFATALEVLVANDIEVRISEGDEFTPTPVISHAILTYNRGLKAGFADGIVITPSHNPPQEGGFKYNPPNGGPAETSVTKWIEKRANDFLKNGMEKIKRIPFESALKKKTTKKHNFIDAYIADLGQIIDMGIISSSQLSLGVDPLGGAGVHYWKKISDRYRLNLTVVSEIVDPTFRFMTVDWDGQIRMDPSSSYAMNRLIDLKDQFDIAFACDTDHDRHGIVTKSTGLMQPNHFLSAAIFYIFQHRSEWPRSLAVGKTLVSSQMIDFITTKLGRKLYEVPVGFKWFVDGLFDGSLGFVGEESAGATFLRFDGTVWTTDKDGIIPALLAAEMTAKTGQDPSQLYETLTVEFGTSYYERVDAPATLKQKAMISKLTAEQVKSQSLAGEQIQSIITTAPGNGAPIGGLKVISKNGWFAARPSGTEDIYKIYGESFKGQDHLDKIIEEAQSIVSEAISFATQKEYENG